jgi:hypothetical protein
MESGSTREALQQARRYAAAGDDEAAKQAYLCVLRLDPAHLPALREIGALATAGGHRSAARTAFLQAIHHHPQDPGVRVAVANLLAEDGDQSGARLQYRAALEIDPDFAPAHQGLARVLADLRDLAAEAHWQKGFAGHAVDVKRYFGAGTGVPLLLLVSARGGNVPTRNWIDDRVFAVTAVYAEFFDRSQPLPPHSLVVSAIGDADLCADALRCAEAILSGTSARVFNPPARVRQTGREAHAQILGRIPGVVAPRTVRLPRTALSTAEDLGFPLLLRAPGFHTGQHFVRVETREELRRAAEALPGEDLLAIAYLDTRGPDGLARKYRVMIIDGVLHPLHLAISADWKVHYFTAAMAGHAAHRAEEQRFLHDMNAVLGCKAMAALAAIGAAMGLDYAGVDFALAADGSVLLFEANATMVILLPDSDPMWGYRRPAVSAARDAARRMLLRHVGSEAQ